MISTIHRKLVMLSVYQSLLFLAIFTTATRTGEASSSYVSVETLDHYGNAIQLGHAKEATRRYGRPVIVAVVIGCKQDDSTENESAGRSEGEQQQFESQEIEDNRSRSSFVMVVSLGKSPILHPIQLPLETTGKTSPPFLAMCLTGLKGDAHWLLQKLQKFAAAVWERYDTDAMPVPILAHAVARILVKFAEKLEHEEWQSSLGLPGKHDRDDDRESSWSRPLGVQTIILSSSSYSPKSSTSPDYQQRQREPALLIVEPSGRILDAAATTKSGTLSLGAVGKECDQINERLIRLLRDNSQGESADMDKESCSSWEDYPPTSNICRDELIRILLEETTSSISDKDAAENHSVIDILVESYSSDRGKIERRLFRAINGNTFAQF